MARIRAIPANRIHSQRGKRFTLLSRRGLVDVPQAPWTDSPRHSRLAASTGPYDAAAVRRAQVQMWVRPCGNLPVHLGFTPAAQTILADQMQCGKSLLIRTVSGPGNRRSPERGV